MCPAILKLNTCECGTINLRVVACQAIPTKSKKCSVSSWLKDGAQSVWIKNLALEKGPQDKMSICFVIIERAFVAVCTKWAIQLFCWFSRWVSLYTFSVLPCQGVSLYFFVKCWFKLEFMGGFSGFNGPNDEIWSAWWRFQPDWLRIEGGTCRPHIRPLCPGRDTNLWPLSPNY